MGGHRINPGGAGAFGAGTEQLTLLGRAVMALVAEGLGAFGSIDSAQGGLTGLDEGRVGGGGNGVLAQAVGDQVLNAGKVTWPGGMISIRTSRVRSDRPSNSGPDTC